MNMMQYFNGTFSLVEGVAACRAMQVFVYSTRAEQNSVWLAD